MSDKKRYYDKIDLDEYEDYESEDLDDSAAGDNEYIGGLWARYGYNQSGADRASAVTTAHRMVQTFVDTFAPYGESWRVSFDPGMSTAGTNFTGQAIKVTTGPVFDKTLTLQRAGVILTAMATHEVSHSRYGRATAAAVRRAFGPRQAPAALSNLLDDVRIERRFAADYPGYSDVFQPMLDYVAEAAIKVDGRQVMTLEEPLNLAVHAIRYARWVEWPDELRRERDWWQAWAARWAKEDSPRRHVEGVREGLRHLRATRIRRQRPKIALAVPSPIAEGMTEYGALVKAAVGAMPPVVQKVVRLSSEGRSPEEVSAILQIPTEAVRVYGRQARRAIALSRESALSPVAAAKVAAVLTDLRQRGATP